MKYKRKITLIFILALIVSSVTFISVSVVRGASEFSDWDADDVEKDAIAGYLDVYVNVSIVPKSPLGKAMSIESVQYITVRGAMFISPRVVLTEIYGYDILQTHGFDVLASSDYISVNHNQLSENEFGTKAYEDITETGYTGWSNRDTEPVYRYTEKELLRSGASSAILYNATAYLNSASDPADNAGIIADDVSEFNGVDYIADDGKSPYNYAEDIAHAYGGSLHKYLNCSIVFFGFNDLEYLTNTLVSFETDLGSANVLGVNAFLIKRKCFQLFKRARESVQDKAKTTVSKFKALTGTISGLVDIPIKATHYIKESIGKGLSNSKIGVRAIAGDAWAFLKSWVGKVVAWFGGIFGIIFIGGAIALTVFIVKKRRS